MAKNNKDKEPEFLPSPLNNNMPNYRVYYMSFREKLSALLATFVLGGLAGFVFYGGMFKHNGEVTRATVISNVVVFCLAGLLAAKCFIPMIVKNKKEKRDKRLRKQFMDLLETLSTSLAAGSTVNDSFINARNDMLNQYTENDDIIRELAEINAGIKNGKTLDRFAIRAVIPFF